MGTDIHSAVEIRTADGWRHATGPIVTPLDKWSDPAEPFGWRSYRVFGFLADVRNDSGSPVITQPRGLPVDVSPDVAKRPGEDCDTSWLTLAELLAYDYDQEFEDQRPFGDEPARTTVRAHLGDLFFQHLDELSKLGPPDDVRVVFWFGY